MSGIVNLSNDLRTGYAPRRREEIIKLISAKRKNNHPVADGEDSSDGKADADIEIVNYIKSLAGGDWQTKMLLSHFNSKLKGIVRDVINTSSTTHDENVIREILDRCHKESISRLGTLHSDDYYIPLDEAALGWPYDADYEAEAYYEHEDRLDLDENYARNFKEECERRSRNRSKRQEEWVGVWVRALDQCGESLLEPILFDSGNSSSRHE